MLSNNPLFQSEYSPYKAGAQRSGTADWDSAGYLLPGPESGMAVSHVLSLQAIIGSSSNTYFMGRYDEALNDSLQNADAMRNDPFIRRLVDERKYGVCSLKCSIEVDNDQDPWQKAVKSILTQVWKEIPKSYDLNWYLNEAIWYGRYAGQFSWVKKVMNLPALPKVGGVVPGMPAILGQSSGLEKREVLCMQSHMPYEGDKIGYDYNGCPYILVSTMAETSLKGFGAEIGPIPSIRAKSMEYGFTTAGGRALFLRDPSWRQRFAIHTGEVLDSPFYDSYKGDQVHGIGIRSVIYWYWWLRDEFLANVSDWCARVGQGVRIWYFEAGNPTSEAAVTNAAKQQSNQNVNILIPRTPGTDKPPEGVEFVDTSNNGSELLLKLVQWAEEHISLYCVGQNMSSGAQENNGSGFGDRGRADFAQSTKHKIVQRDAAKYSDTMTDDVLKVMARWSLPPDLWEIPVRVVYHADVPDPESFMTAVKTYTEIGGEAQDNQVRNVLGLSDVNPGDKVLGGSGPDGMPKIGAKPQMPPGMNGEQNGKPPMPAHDRGIK